METLNTMNEFQKVVHDTKLVNVMLKFPYKFRPYFATVVVYIIKDKDLL